MKRIIYLVGVILLLNFIHSKKCFSQDRQSIKSTRSGDYEKQAQIWIESPVLTFFTPTEVQIEKVFKVVIRAGLLGKTEWLEVKDSSQFTVENTFILESTIRDFTQYFKINLHLTSLRLQNGKKIDEWKFYSIKPDSILSGFQEIIDDLSVLIYRGIQKSVANNPEIYIQRFKVEGFKSDSIIIGEFISKFLMINFSNDPTYFKTKLLSNSPNENEPNQGYLIKGDYKIISENKYRIVAEIFQLNNSSKIYEVKKELTEYSLKKAANLVFEEISEFLYGYSKLKNFIKPSWGAFEYYDLAEKYYNSENEDSLQISRILCRLSLNVDNEYVPALNLLGMLEMLENHYEESLELFKSAQEIEPENIESNIGLALGYYYTENDDLAIKKFEQIASLCRKLHNKKSEADVYYWLGEIYSSQGDFDLALKNYEKSLSLNDNYKDVWFKIGSAYFSLYFKEEKPYQNTTYIENAYNVFKKATERFSDEPSFRYYQAYVLNYWGKKYYEQFQAGSKGNYAELAYDKFKQSSVIKQYDANLQAENFTYLAYIEQFVNANLDASVEYITKAYNLNKESEWTLRLFGILYLKRHELKFYPEAKKALLKAIGLNDTWSTYSILGDIYYELRQYDSATYAYNNAIKKNSDNSFLNYHLKNIYNSAVNSKNPQVYSIAISNLKYGLENGYPKDKGYAYLIKVDFLNKNKSDYYPEKIQEAFENNPQSSDVFKLLESLYFDFHDTLALRLSILQLEKNSARVKSFKDLWKLGYSYFLNGEGNKCLELVRSNMKLIDSKVDSADAFAINGFGYYLLGKNSLERNTDGGEYFESAVINFENAAALYPNWPTPRSYLVGILHDDIPSATNFEKSYQYAVEIMKIDSSSSGDNSNLIEATLTIGKLEETIEMAQKLLATDSFGVKKMTNSERLAIRFILITAEILRGNSLGAYSYFGDFYNIYSITDIDDITWNWNGTKFFIKNYDINNLEKERLLNILSTLETPDISNLEKLKKIESQWILSYNK